MQWSAVPTKLAELYQTAAAWVYGHPVETDILIIGVAAFCITKLYQSRYRRTRRHIRFIRGSWMSRDDRMKYQLMRFEDAISDAALDMMMEGRMSELEEKHWYTLFATRYEFPGLLPRRDKETIKRGIKTRIWFYRNKLKVRLPEGKPQPIPDPTYLPDGNSALAKSKYAKAAE